jgi:Leucine-rich repeat (LRR) protein
MKYRKIAMVLIALGIFSSNFGLSLDISKATESQEIFIEINEGVVEFKDPVIELAVRSELSLDDREDIKEIDLSRINRLLIVNGLTSLEGVERMTNLKKIALNCSKVKDLSPLKNLNLNGIYLDNLNVDESEFSFLENQKNLCSLSLNNCNLSKIPPISSLEELKYLSLNDSKISDIKTLSKLNKLIDLELNNNNINDIETLSNFTELKYLDLGNNNISDIAAIEDLSNIESLNLSNNDIKDISAIKNNKNLSILHIGHNPIEDISTISKMNLLKDVDIGYTNIDNINVLSNLYKLERIDCSGLKNVKSVRGLIFLPNVKSLYMSDNPQLDFSTISIPKFKDTIKYLSIDNSDLKNLNFMSGLNPNYLSIKNNKIESLEGLKNCSRLFKIVADENEIKSLKGCESLDELVSIFIEGNDITLSDEDNRVISSLPELEILDVSKNLIEDIKIGKTESLKKLIISNNKITNIENLKANLPNLEYLEFNNMTLDNLEFLNGCENVIKIVMNNTKVLNQENLKSLHLPSLEWLEINGSDLKDLSFLGSISNKDMHTVDISNTNIDFSSIPKDLDIFDFKANNCGLKDLNTIPNLNIIGKLTAQSNEMEILDLKNMNPYVYELDFSHNKIKEVKNIPEFKKLEKFEMEDNEVDESIVNLANFTKIVDEPQKHQNDLEISNLIPEGWNIFAKYGENFIIDGDLNKDGIEDKAFVIENDELEDEASKRNLIIAFGRNDGGYDFSVRANQAILNEEDGGTFGDPFEGIEIDRGSILLKFMGGSSRWSKSFRFRYQDEGWYLIGYTKGAYESLGEEMVCLKKDYNLLTGDYIEDIVEDGKVKNIKKNIGTKPLINLDDFKVAEY